MSDLKENEKNRKKSIFCNVKDEQRIRKMNIFKYEILRFYIIKTLIFTPKIRLQNLKEK